MNKKVIIGSDHAGFSLKEKVSAYLKNSGVKVEDAGTYSDERCDYPEFAYKVAAAVSGGRFKRGILICYTGIGNSIVANKLNGVRAALCHNAKAAELSRRHNDSNILVLGSLFVKEKAAKKIIDIWLNTEFEAGRHRRRLNMLRRIEKER
ncbi:MAG: ribose 5-phosphate isomerase B [Candidatus Omnitrophota bacterium]|nr:ribose 5-phosphate isomerase B [Candidatus Omnitrophota bacterium]